MPRSAGGAVLRTPEGMNQITLQDRAAQLQCALERPTERSREAKVGI